MKKDQSNGHWFIALCALGIGLGGCADMQPENVNIEGLPYSFPKGDVDRVVLPKDGMLYVRLKETSLHYILILDSMVDRAERQRGHPVVASLNFGRHAKTEIVDAVGGPVICRDRPGLNCGFRIDDSGIRWSVIFDRNDIAKVPSIRRSALNKVQTYREG